MEAEDTGKRRSPQRLEKAGVKSKVVGGLSQKEKSGSRGKEGWGEHKDHLMGGPGGGSRGWAKWELGPG